MRNFHALMTLLVASVSGGVFVTHAQGPPPVVIETVPVGNPGNPGEQSRLAHADPTLYGGVAYTFGMGKWSRTRRGQVGAER